MKIGENTKWEIISWVIFLPTAIILSFPVAALVHNKTLKSVIAFFIGIMTMIAVQYFIQKYRDKKKHSHEYTVRMCSNCGREEKMHFTERWCKRCRKE